VTPRRWALLVALACAAEPARAASQDTAAASSGRLFERLVSRADSTQTYALFLPVAYTPARRWPVMFILDPRGRALLPLGRLRAAADDRGFVLMSSYNSVSDGPIEPNIAAMNAMLADAQRALSTDERRLYVAGFSGTARAAWMFARELGERVPGIIGAGAGIDRSFFGDDTARRTLVFYGAVGRHDFNYDEMRELDALLDTLGLQHRVRYVGGGHEWPPDSVLAAALEWLDLQAMRRGLRSYDTAWVERLAHRQLAAARSLEASGPVLEAVEAYQAIASDFSDLPHAREARDRVSALAERADAHLALANRARLAHASARYRAMLDLAMGALDGREGRPSARDLRRLLKIDSLKSQAAQGPGEAADAAQRLLQFVFVISSFYQPRHYIGRGDHERALIALEVAAMIDGQNPRVCLHRGYAWALGGRVKEAIRDLECARRAGVLTATALADRALDRIRGSPEFRALADAVRGAS